MSAHAHPYMGKDSNATMVKVGHILDLLRTHINETGEIADFERHLPAIDSILLGAINCLFEQVEINEEQAQKEAAQVQEDAA
ncbi:MAG: hypothetical protein VXY23_15880 [Pseudomonadota bacterium]|jgi:hypothetical protein|nr:hypothetical protein [Pseudomonadota bacterium]